MVVVGQTPNQSDSGVHLDTSLRAADVKSDIVAESGEAEIARDSSAFRILRKELGKSRYAPLSHDALVDLMERIYRGTQGEGTEATLTPDAAEAKKEIFERNLRLVAAIANRMTHSPNSTLGAEDLFQIGSERLWKIIERFEVARGLKFSTFVGTAVHNVMVTALRERTDDPISNDDFKRLHLIEEAVSRIRDVGKARYPTEQEILEEVRRHSSKKFQRRHGRLPELDELPQIIRDLSVARIKNIYRLDYRRAISLDLPNNAFSMKPDNRTIADSLVAPAAHDFLDLVGHFERRLLAEALPKLQERDRLVLCLYFGVGREDAPMNGGEIGRELGISRQRVEQIKVRALKNLRELLGEGEV